MGTWERKASTILQDVVIDSLDERMSFLIRLPSLLSP